MRGVFDQSFVPCLLIAELELDDPELMLNLGSDRGLKVFEFFDGVAHPFTLALNGFALGRLHGDMPGGFDMFGVFAFLNTGVARITKDGFFFPMHQLVRLGNVMLVGRCRFNTVNQTRLCIGTDMSLHTKVPVVALFGLMHLRIPFATGILGRGRCLNKSGINDGALLEQQATLGQHRVDLFEKPASQLVFLKQVPKVQDSVLVLNAATGQRQACKLTHRLHVVEHFFHGRIAQRKPLLHKVNPKHRLKRIRRTTSCAFGINRFNQRTQPCLRNHLIHFGKEFVAPRLLTLGTEFNVRKAQLGHDRETEVSDTIQTINRVPSSMNSVTFSEDP